MRNFSFIIALSLVSIVQGFGHVGHWLSGRIAQEFLSVSTRNLSQELLPEYGGNLGPAACWADSNITF